MWPVKRLDASGARAQGFPWKLTLSNAKGISGPLIKPFDFLPILYMSRNARTCTHTHMHTHRNPQGNHRMSESSMGPPEWCGGLRHCIAVLAVPVEILVRVQALSQPSMTGRPMGWCTIGPATSGLGEGLAGRDVPVP